MDIKKQYEQSCVYNGTGKSRVLSGHLAFNPAGHLVKLPPNSVKLIASVENGIEIFGLKSKWKLADRSSKPAAAPKEGAKPAK